MPIAVVVLIGAIPRVPRQDRKIQSRRDDAVIRITSITVLLTLILPTTVYLLFSTSSMSAGLLVCALAWSFVGMAGGDKPFILKKADSYAIALMVAGIAFLTAHVLISELQLGRVDFTRFFFSSALLLLVWIGAHFAAAKLIRVPTIELVTAANVALTILTLLGIAAAAGVPAIGGRGLPKPVVIFSEPSHFALSYLPMLLFRVAIGNRTTQLLLIGVALCLAIILQSFTMVAGILIISGLVLRRISLVVMMTAVALAAFTLDLTYYSDRVSLSSDTTNISVLVFMQGWENAVLNFQETHGLGVGFQQFGVAGSIGDISNKIAELLGGEYINLLDGGSTATKLVAEFGVVGVLALLVFMKAVFRGIRFIRKAQSLSPSHRDQRSIFFYSLITSYSLEVWIRGLGYFSPGGFLALVGLMALYGSNKRKESTQQSASLLGVQPLHCPPADGASADHVQF
jgi:hypothetical protein